MYISKKFCLWLIQKLFAQKVMANHSDQAQIGTGNYNESRPEIIEWLIC